MSRRLEPTAAAGDESESGDGTASIEGPADGTDTVDDPATDSVPGFAGGTALLALAVLAAVLLARARSRSR